MSPGNKEAPRGAGPSPAIPEDIERLIFQVAHDLMAHRWGKDSITERLMRFAKCVHAGKGAFHERPWTSSVNIKRADADLLDASDAILENAERAPRVIDILVRFAEERRWQRASVLHPVTCELLHPDLGHEHADRTHPIVADEWGGRSVEQLDLSPATVLRIRKVGLNTVGELLKAGRLGLRRTPNVGRKIIDELVWQLLRRGILLPA